MTELLLEPYAARQIWTARRPLGPGEWQTLFVEYVERIAAGCAAENATSGPVIIGHIKLLALFADGEYLRVSAVSAAHPPTVSGVVPVELSEVETTINVIVYGLSRATLAALTSQAAAASSAQWSATATLLPPTEHNEHAH